MISLNNLQEFYRLPFPHGLCKNVFDKKLYKTLVSNWPDIKLFKKMKEGDYKKFSLSSVQNKENYELFIKNNPCWKELYDYLHSRIFIHDVVLPLFENQKIRFRQGTLLTRFEFSSIPANGGLILPHTDIPSKIITMVLPIYLNGWNLKWGGGTDILEQKDINKVSLDYKTPLEEFNIIKTFNYEPNQCVIFAKTDKSWHSVGPFHGPDKKFRNTLTINIERF
jgi:hypothetical protein